MIFTVRAVGDEARDHSRPRGAMDYPRTVVSMTAASDQIARALSHRLGSSFPLGAPPATAFLLKMILSKPAVFPAQHQLHVCFRARKQAAFADHYHFASDWGIQ